MVDDAEGLSKLVEEALGSLDQMRQQIDRFHKQLELANENNSRQIPHEVSRQMRELRTIVSDLQHEAIAAVIDNLDDALEKRRRLLREAL